MKTNAKSYPDISNILARWSWGASICAAARLRRKCATGPGRFAPPGACGMSDIRPPQGALAVRP
jgi:hypothetical protein